MGINSHDLYTTIISSIPAKYHNDLKLTTVVDNCISLQLVLGSTDGKETFTTTYSDLHLAKLAKVSTDIPREKFLTSLTREIKAALNSSGKVIVTDKPVNLTKNTTEQDNTRKIVKFTPKEDELKPNNPQKGIELGEDRYLDLTIPPSEEIKQEAIEAIDNIFKNKRSGTITLEYIRSFGNPILELEFTKQFVARCKNTKIGYSPLCDEILTNPSYFLDPTKIDELNNVEDSGEQFTMKDLAKIGLNR